MQSIVSQQEELRELQRFSLKVSIKGASRLEGTAQMAKGAGK